MRFRQLWEFFTEAPSHSGWVPTHWGASPQPIRRLGTLGRERGGVALGYRLVCQKPSCGQKPRFHTDSQFWEFFTEVHRHFEKKTSEVPFTYMVMDKWVKLEHILGQGLPRARCQPGTSLFPYSLGEKLISRPLYENLTQIQLRIFTVVRFERVFYKEIKTFVFSSGVEAQLELKPGQQQHYQPCSAPD